MSDDAEHDLEVAAGLLGWQYIADCYCVKCQNYRAGLHTHPIDRIVSLSRVMPVCARGCGNKRCPCASNHVLPCTRSNDPGQAGSMYR